MAIGGLISRTQRQLSASVMTPPSSTPAAPPTPFIAAHRPIARCSAGPAANEEVMIASELAAISAPPKPWNRARDDQRVLVRREPAGERGDARTATSASDERPALPEVVGCAAAEHQEAGERDRVGVDDPLQVRRREAEARLDRRQRDVDDAQVEDDHELRHAAHGEQPARARAQAAFRGPRRPRAGGAAGRAFVSVKDPLQTAGKRYRTPRALFPLVTLRRMQVIGAGLPRTGTLSQKIALEMLGFGPCYHMVNVLADLDLARTGAGRSAARPTGTETFAGLRVHGRLAGLVLLQRADRRVPRREGRARHARRRVVGAQHARDDLGRLLRRRPRPPPFRRPRPSSTRSGAGTSR